MIKVAIMRVSPIPSSYIVVSKMFFLYISKMPHYICAARLAFLLYKLTMTIFF
jgi:hypothetical protein